MQVLRSGSVLLIIMHWVTRGTFHLVLVFKRFLVDKWIHELQCELTYKVELQCRDPKGKTTVTTVVVVRTVWRRPEATPKGL